MTAAGKAIAVVQPSRGVLAGGVLLLCALALAPIVALLGFAALGEGPAALALGPDGREQVLNTVALVAGVGVFGAALGTATGWLTACCHFPGRRWLRIAQLLPLATPSYLLAATLVDLGSRWQLRVHGLGWTVLVLTLSTYSYVFLLATESFSASGQRQLEACRSLGVGPWGSFARVALPMALPAVGAGLALSGMEVVNELGAVELLGLPTLSSGILQRWQGEGNPEAAVGLALMALLIVSLLVGAERQLRGRSRRWVQNQGGDAPQRWPLAGWRRLAAQTLTLLPPLATLGLPLLWATLSWDQLQGESASELLALTGRSLLLALAAAVLTVATGLVLAIARRWLPSPLLQRLSFSAGMGYAIPGTVLALALMLIGGPLALSPLLLLLWGYGDRFLAVAKGGLDAALERLPPSVDEAATSLGCSWPQVLLRVHLPLLREPLLVAGLLVFVDTVKELPLTFALRPFDFDTLSVRVFQYASDERVGAALLPALLILMLGLVASLALIPSLESDRRHGG
ncbi:iron ABC transporter permease [Cyanobium sp. Morenito 9A2]|uniref:ABC transporter permease n=1 Tax=Cyanobium sp. Morenito 9A2 TaxID=2823718 RepID=UPI0020CBDF5E|nr:iron ABC transporter permease [Cyanobium sp. Morenito 9A2]MCP9848433.1 iron ABC transporter permease [Cyanobium sp. Morenito 9A2]